MTPHDDSPTPFVIDRPTPDDYRQYMRAQLRRYAGQVAADGKAVVLDVLDARGRVVERLTVTL